MTPHDLIAAFDVLADAPDGVKRLRELVLSLAVRGKLVPQEAEDGTAALTPDPEAPRRRKAKSASVSAACERFDIPASWKWTTLGEATHDCGSKVPDQTFTYLDVGSIDNLRGVVGEELSVIQPEDAPSRARKLVRPGTVIYSTVRPYLLNIAKIERDYVPEPIASTAFAVLHPYTGLDFRFLYYVLRTPFFIAFVSNVMKGVAYPAISDADLMTAEFPLPPLAEQHRIVARVDELMGLLDRLEAARATRDAVRRAARDAALADLRDAPDAEAVEAAWGRIARQMDDLFAEPEDVAPLRQAVLQLAVRGKLVPQAQHETLGKNLVSAEPPVDGDTPFPLPRSWTWLRLPEASDYHVGKTPPTKDPSYWSENSIPWVSIGDMPDGGTVVSTSRTVTARAAAEIFRRAPVAAGTILMSFKLTIGKVAMLGVNAYHNEAIISITPKASVEKRFLFIFMPILAAGGETKAAIKGATLNGQSLARILIPVPPLAEQRRIVAKVDALMALCDDLEARLTSAGDLHGQFAGAAVHHLDA